MDHFNQHPDLQSNTRYSGLFNKPTRSRKGKAIMPADPSEEKLKGQSNDNDLGEILSPPDYPPWAHPPQHHLPDTFVSSSSYCIPSSSHYQQQQNPLNNGFLPFQPALDHNPETFFRPQSDLYYFQDG
jgi:hypothetical protein